MRKRMIVGLGVVLMASLSLLVQGTRQSAIAQAPGGFDLRRLMQLHNDKLSDVEAARLYLSFLQEEIANPSPMRKGIGGGPITHEYILAQIVLAGMHAKANGGILWQTAATAPPGEYRDAIMLTLGLLGDQRAAPFLIEYLGNPRNSPYLRERAARALADHPTPDAVPVLAAALQDPFWLRASQLGLQMKHYPVRSEARLALRRLRETGFRLPPDVQRAFDTAVTSEPLPPPPPGNRK